MSWPCPACEHTNDEEFDVCERCGTSPGGEANPDLAADEATLATGGTSCDPMTTPVICHQCLAENACDAHFCTKCNAPLTPHASTDPIGRVISIGNMWQRVFWDKPVTKGWFMLAWVALGPGILVCIIAGVLLLGSIAEDFGSGKTGLGPTVLSLLLSLGFLALAVFVQFNILRSVTRAYTGSPETKA